MRLKWLLVVAVVFLAVGLFLLQLLGPSSAVLVGPRTTVISSPLAADGLPDYAQALVDPIREGVTRENNGAREFWQALGPAADASPDDYRLLSRELGVPPDPAPVYLEQFAGRELRNRLVDWLKSQSDADHTMVLRDGFSAEAAASNSLGVDPIEETVADEILDYVMTAPWAAADYPPLAAWAAANEGPLDLLVEGAAKPKFYSPSPNFLTKPTTPLISMLLPHLQAERSALRALAARAMLRAGEKQHAAAWQDCMSCWQLGNHAANGPTLVDKLVGYAMRGVARECTLALLACNDLPEGVAQQILNDLSALPPEVSVVDSLDRAERFMYLDTCLRVFARRFGGMDLSELGDAGKVMPVFLASDANVPLEIGNEWYDRLVKAARVQGIQARKKELNRLDDDIQSLTRDIKTRIVGGIFSRQMRSALMGDVMVSMFLPATSSALAAQDRDAAGLLLARIAAAPAVFRAQHGEYPAKLEELTPGLLASSPIDPYDGQQLPHYERRGQGYLLYSVFENGADDGGRNFDGEIDKGEWLPTDQSLDYDPDHSDIVIRLPRPTRTLIAVAATPTADPLDLVDAETIDEGTSDSPASDQPSDDAETQNQTEPTPELETK